MFGNCPKCGKAVMQLSQQQIAVPPAFDQHSLKATTLSCLSCKTIIGVVPDYWSLVGPSPAGQGLWLRPLVEDACQLPGTVPLLRPARPDQRRRPAGASRRLSTR